MAIPKEQYMKLTGGTNASNSDIYTGNKIKIGDTLKITGTGDNNGIYTVSSISTNSDDVYYVLKGRSIVSETDNTGHSPKIEVIRPTGDKLCAIADSTTDGNIAVWSTNNSATRTSRDDGWDVNAITPTISGFPAKYIYFFVDEALRVCNINEESESLIKWFGFIQRDQFGNIREV